MTPRDANSKGASDDLLARRAEALGLPVELVRHPADTRNTIKARAACPWLSVDESLGLPGWLLEMLHEATPATIRSRLGMMSDRYLMSLAERRLADLEAEPTHV